MVNPSKVLTSIKMDLGLYALSLPFGDTDEVLMDVIKEKTLPVFNELAPYKMRLPLDLRTLTKIKDSYSESVYLLPDAFGEHEIMYVLDVQPYVNNLNASLGAYSQDSVYGVMLSQVHADVMSTIEPSFTFEFERPNKLHLFNMDNLYGKVELHLALTHAENLSTIPKTSLTSFKELATLDVKAFLYNQLKHYNEVQTAHGTINLKIDDWSNAESERRDLISRWEDTYHFDMPQAYIV